MLVLAGISYGGKTPFVLFILFCLQQPLDIPNSLVTMPKATPGTMIQCDPAIIAIIEKLNEEDGRAFVQTCLDDEHLLIQTEKIDELKGLLNAVRPSHPASTFSTFAKRSCSGAEIHSERSS